MAAFTLKQRVPVRDADRFMSAIGQVEQGKVRSFIPVLSCLVESWEYPGDPSDPAAYDDLDLFAEFLPMVREAEAHISATLGNR